MTIECLSTGYLHDDVVLPLLLEAFRVLLSLQLVVLLCINLAGITKVKNVKGKTKRIPVAVVGDAIL